MATSGQFKSFPFLFATLTVATGVLVVSGGFYEAGGVLIFIGGVGFVILGIVKKHTERWMPPSISYQALSLKPVMPEAVPTDDGARCSFCSKSRDQVKKLIAGPTIYICNECVDVCNEIIADDVIESKSDPSSPELPT